jgi:hypothetical protein
LVLGLVFLNYQSAFRAVNTMFNGVADGIYNLSGGVDVIQGMGEQPLPSVELKPQLVFFVCGTWLLAASQLLLLG